jgi:hypothetical protein
MQGNFNFHTISGNEASAWNLLFKLENTKTGHDSQILLAQGSKTLQHSKIPAAQNLGGNLCKTPKFPAVNLLPQVNTN